VSSTKSKDASAPVVEDTHKVQEDVDAAFKETVTRALTKINVKEVIEKPTPDDENKTFRTRLVAVWMLSNASLAVAIENLNGLPNTTDPIKDQVHLRDKQNLYFSVILYSTFALAAFRFAGVSTIVRNHHRTVTDPLFCSVSSTSSRGTCSDSAGGTDGGLAFPLAFIPYFKGTFYSLYWSLHTYLIRLIMIHIYFASPMRSSLTAGGMVVICIQHA
jgi:hypothetical protein